MSRHLIATGMSTPPPYPRRKRHAAQALHAVDRLLELVGPAPDPVLALAGSLASSDASACALCGDWAAVVRAHALDLYADAGHDATVWPRALGEALHMLVRLRNKEDRWLLRVPGLSIEVQPHPARARARPTPPVQEVSLLTMEDVLRQLQARPARQVWQDTEELCDLLPHANLPRLALATGAVQALAAAGPLSGFDQMTMGGAHWGWQACVRWPPVPRPRPG